MKVLFLGYNSAQTGLLSEIERRGHRVSHTDGPINDLSGYDLVISFGYRHILRAHVLATASRPVLNLHISYLPWNKGAHPLFWSAVEGTPNGVTIHEIDAGIDTGPICYQRRVEIDEDETFQSGYTKLIAAIEDLFMTNIEALLSGRYVSAPQAGGGSLHRSRDLPSGFEWSERIATVTLRLKATAEAKMPALV